MVAQPSLDGYDRIGAVGLAWASNVPPGVTCHAYAISSGNPPTVTEVGSLVGEGEIHLNLSAFEWTFFGYHIHSPLTLFLINEDSGNYSLPSTRALPTLFDVSIPSLSIGVINRDNDGTTIKFSCSGIDTDGNVFCFWTKPDDTLGIYGVVNGDNAIPGFVWNKKYTLVFVQFNNKVQLAIPQSKSEIDYRVCKVISV
jgi:hypothetical protein